MKTFDYGDNQIGTREVSMTISSIMIGIGILTLPSMLASHIEASDGWVSILAAGSIAAACGLVVCRLTSRFQGSTFHNYTAKIATKPIASLISAIYGIYFLLYLAYEVRSIAKISRMYLLENTPIAFITVAFLLIVVYAVSGTTAAMLRLNTMFLPIVLLISGVVLLFGIELMSFNNLKPFMTTSPLELVAGTKDTTFALLGFEVLLFYAPLLRPTVRTEKAMLIGIAIPVVLCLLTYLYSVAIFTREATAQILFPTVEIAKEVRLPGQFFERLESIFFTVWIMTIFNTSCMAMEASVSCLQAIVSKFDKRLCILILCPIAYFINMLPENMLQYQRFGWIVSYIGYGTAGAIPIILLIVARLRKGETGG
ncbi:GerAB/ArcD/ProY family transporter [Cohnella hashimotonis]|uniref:Endospore germination permease n=1 Tax=Cohnella hashimotonis TaxID=2826895 RepID=A0ABT6TEI5_9BACL|nr:endospore germination permease [Cohnella hashimotonis]MDI4644738.1 endospore germination permease [Cohnella hashimotonis]